MQVMSDLQLATRRKRWATAAIKFAVAAAVVWFIRGAIVEAWTELGKHELRLDYSWLVLAGALYLIGMIPCALFWHRTLLALGQRVGFGSTLRAYFIGHLGKYVPGKAMVVIIRAGMIRGPGVDSSLAVASVFYETLTMMAVGALLGAAIVACCFHGHPLLLWAALAIMVVAGLPTLPPVFKRLARLAGMGRINPETPGKLANLGYGTVLLGWLLNAVGWAILGLSFWAVLRGMGLAENNFPHLPHLHVAAVALATVAGFISMLPGGAVVREAVLTELMIPHLGGGAALIAAVLLRLVWLAAELCIAGGLYLTPCKKLTVQNE
ncbi:MAG: flippase-like domain-containing protein [Pirellulaceae bacterium]|nr:flippase-like domain-containing protein [Pirellulaceae bacterium]